MSGLFDWAFTDPGDPTGGYLARILGIGQPPSSPIVAGMIPNRSAAGMGGALGLGQGAPAAQVAGGIAQGAATGGWQGAAGGAVGSGLKLLLPYLLAL